MLDFVGRRNWYYLFSLLLLLPGTISLLFPPRLRAGIEFTSGSTFTVRFGQPVTAGDLSAALSSLGHPEARVQGTGDNTYLVRTKELKGTADAPVYGPALPSERDNLEAALEAKFGGLRDSQGNPTKHFQEFSSVSASVSRQIGRNAAIAVAAASIAILLYISWAFSSVPKPLRYGTSAVVALMHDVLLVVGAFSIFGKLFDTEVNTMFITGLLTVVGFSVHDSIVVFDRIRETVTREPRRNFADAVNTSLLQTVGRSFNTSLTLIFSILALLLLGGESIRSFLLVLLIGTATGTYSSVFIASMLLVTWEEGDIPRLFRRFFPKRPKVLPVEEGA